MLDELSEMIRPGVTTYQLNLEAEKLISKLGGRPNFKNYEGYPASICASVNDEVVHGIPSQKRILKEGDIISIDAGIEMNGYHSDAARTFGVGSISPECALLIKNTRSAFFAAMKAAVSGGRLYDISNAVASYIEETGSDYGIVRELTGHGIGRKMHENPMIPNYHKRTKGPRLSKGNTLAVEPMITMGDRAIWLDQDRWTVRTRDGKPAAHFEHTVAVRKGKAEILSSFEEAEKVEGVLY